MFLFLLLSQVTNIIYTRVKSLVLTILHGAFDSSAIVLLIFKVRGVQLSTYWTFFDDVITTYPIRFWQGCVDYFFGLKFLNFFSFGGKELHNLFLRIPNIQIYLFGLKFVNTKLSLKKS